MRRLLDIAKNLSPEDIAFLIRMAETLRDSDGKKTQKNRDVAA